MSLSRPIRLVSQYFNPTDSNDLKSNVNRILPFVFLDVDFRREGNASSVIEKASKCELKKPVEGSIRARRLTRRIRIDGARVVPAIFRLYGIEIGRVRRMVDFRNVRRGELANSTTEIDARQKWMLLDFVRIFAQPLVRTGAQFEDQVNGFRRDVSVGWYSQSILPVDDLRKIEFVLEWHRFVTYSDPFAGHYERFSSLRQPGCSLMSIYTHIATQCPFLCLSS